MTDAEISCGVLHRDERVMETVINHYSRLLWRVCAAVLQHSGGTQEIEECVADVFVYLWQHPQSYDPSRSTLKTYLCMIARSRATDAYRRLSRRRTLSLEQAQGILEADRQDGLLEQREALEAALGRLEQQDRDMVMRRYVDCQKPAQIALALGLSSRQVQNRLYRIRMQLRRQLTMENEEEADETR